MKSGLIVYILESNFHGCQNVHWDPLNAKRSCLQFWYGLCESESALFPWQHIADLRMGVCLQIPHISAATHPRLLNLKPN